MSIREWIGAFLIGLGAGLLIVGGILIQVMNIDETRMRILVDHWWFYLPCLVLVFVGMALVGDRKIRR